MKLTPAILREISFQVTHGNPWWGILIANEYMRPSEPLHHALQRQAMQRYLRLRASGAPSLGKLEAMLRSGTRAAQLSPVELARVGARAVPARRSVPSRFRRCHERVNASAPIRRRRPAAAFGAAARIAALPR